MASSTLIFTPVCSSAHPKPRGLPLVDCPLLVLLTSQTLVLRFEHHVQPIPFAVHNHVLHICTLNLYFVSSLILEFVNSEFLYIHQLADSAATALYLVMCLALSNSVEVIFMSSFEQSLPCHWWGFMWYRSMLWLSLHACLNEVFLPLWPLGLRQIFRNNF